VAAGRGQQHPHASAGCREEEGWGAAIGSAGRRLNTSTRHARAAPHNVCFWLNTRLGRDRLAFADLIAW
jgi:hypothetical protein